MDLPTILDITADDSIYQFTVKDALLNRIIILNDQITYDILENATMHLLRWNKEDTNIPADKRQKIVIIINCIGGDCMIGWNFIDVIRAITTPVACVCMGLSASMAYYITIACNERYAFENSVLLQHDGSVTIQNSTSKAKDTMKFCEAMEERTKQFVLDNTKIDEEFYKDHYNQEYYMYADEAKELGCIDCIIGRDVTLDEVFN